MCLSPKRSEQVMASGSITISGNNNTYGQALRGAGTKPH